MIYDTITFNDYFTGRKSLLNDSYKKRKDISADDYSEPEIFEQQKFQNSIWCFFYELLNNS